MVYRQIREKYVLAAAWLLRPGLQFLAGPRIRRYLADSPTPRLHMGCGRHLLPGWLNADVTLALSQHPEGVFMDARTTLPLPDGCLDYVFHEHFLTQLSPVQGPRFSAECYRVLRSGGVIRVACLNLEFLASLVLEPELNSDYVGWAGTTFLGQVEALPAQVVNNLLYGFNCGCMYDYPLLKQLLQESGFTRVRRVEPGHSEHPDLSGVERHGRTIPERFNTLETLVVEARKL